MSALTAHIVRPGSYLLDRGTLKKVPKGSYGIRCDACEYAVMFPRDLEYAEGLRREHLRSAHFTAQLAGAVVLDPDLAS